MDSAKLCIMDGYTIKLCVSEIHCGRMTEAFNYFKQLNDDSKLSIIITDSYNYLSDTDTNNSYNKLNNIENILQFRLKLPSLNLTTMVLQSLFDAMESNNHLDSPKLLMLDRIIKEAIEENSNLDNDNKNELISLKNKSASHIRNIITAWATKVRTNQEHVQIKEFTLKYDMSAEYFSQLVEQSYANNLGNAPTIINFIQGFGHIGNIEQHIVGYSTLIEQMRIHSHFGSSEIFKLAYFIKQFMDNNSNMSIDQKNKFTILTNNLPDAIKRLFWNGFCRIKNIYWSEYLYAADDKFAHDKDRRNVFTWRPRGQVTQGTWKFEPLNNGSCFQIKNITHPEYLYSPNILYDNDRRRVFTWRPGTNVSQGYWTLEPINNATAFRIKNNYCGEYLYAASDSFAKDRDRRSVFTWKPRNPIREGDWILE